MQHPGFSVQPDFHSINTEYLSSGTIRAGDKWMISMEMQFSGQFFPDLKVLKVNKT